MIYDNKYHAFLIEERIFIEKERLDAFFFL